MLTDEQRLCHMLGMAKKEIASAKISRKMIMSGSPHDIGRLGDELERAEKHVRAAYDLAQKKWGEAIDKQQDRG